MSASTIRAEDVPWYRRLRGGKTLTGGAVIYWWLEIIAVLTYYLVYSAVRNADAAHPERAYQHAKQLIGWQKSLGIYHELAIHKWARNIEPLIVGANYFYGSFHFIVTIGVAVFLFRKFPDDFPRWRNTLAIATAIALIGFRFWPLMPPRLLPHSYGFVDTLAKYPTFWSFNSGAMKKISNQYAAMPSVHCCWALWCACALVPRLKHWWAKLIAALYPALTVSVIVMTANHYFLDAVGGFIIFGIGYVGARWITRAGRPREPGLAHVRVSDTPDLDHVAIATTDIVTMLDALVGDLGGTVLHGGDGHGFRWVQTRVGDATAGMTIESLVVWRPEDDDFLARFVARHGGGAHHITFKVPDLPAMLDACGAAGVTPVGVRLDDPEWQEAFLQPRDAHGTVVQLAQTTDPRPVASVLPQVLEHGPSGTPTWWPAPPARGPERVHLRHVVLGSPDRATTVAFFGDLLEGAVTAEDATGTELTWPGGGRIRVEDAARPGVVRFDATGTAPRRVDVAGVPVVVG